MKVTSQVRLYYQDYHSSVYIFTQHDLTWVMFSRCEKLSSWAQVVFLNCSHCNQSLQWLIWMASLKFPECKF